MFIPLRAAFERYAPLADTEWAALVPHIESRKLLRGGHFVNAGRHSTHIGFIQKGMMRSYYPLEGDEITTFFFFENDLVASYISHLTNQPSLVGIQALEDCELLEFPYSVLANLFDQHRGWERLGRRIAEVLGTGLELRLCSLLTQSPEQRYNALMEGRDSLPCLASDELLSRVPQKYLANYLGITAVSLSRIRRRITDRAWAKPSSR